MMLSTRADPPKFLTLSNISKSHPNFRQLLVSSPLPSPSLPSILPRHGKKPPRLNTKRALRYLCWLTILTTIIWIFQHIPHSHSLGNLIYQSSNGKTYQIVGESDLPKFASPVAVTNKRGRSQWTISIPSNLRFPLSATDYDDICLQAEDVSTHVATSRHNLHKIQNLAFQEPDPNYVDIEEAQQTGLLPPSKHLLAAQKGRNVCEKSLTYILDASEAGLGNTLLGLWLSYGLAKEEGRAFFVDYSDFAYGKFTSLFSQLPPAPNCQPPPWEQRTPCPSHAKHLVIGASTLRWTYGLKFQDKYNTKAVFDMVRDGYEALFNIQDEDRKYVEDRLSEQRKSVGDSGLLVGVHIRRGDRHPFEFQYKQGYLPPSKYAAAAQALTKAHPNSITLLASDDADIYHDPELEDTIRAQDKIRLASNKHMNRGGLGWEGGFFSAAFWDIGLPEHAMLQKYVGSPEPTRQKLDTGTAKHADRQRDYRSQPTSEALKLRGYLGRAYLLDLAVLAGSDEVVCAVSSKGCRILAVMMGWDKLHSGKWNNVDGDYGWRALF